MGSTHPCYWRLVVKRDLFKLLHLRTYPTPSTSTDIKWCPLKHVWLASGRYTSYWNDSFLFLRILSLYIKEMSASWFSLKLFSGTISRCLNGLKEKRNHRPYSNIYTDIWTQNITYIFLYTLKLISSVRKLFHFDWLLKIFCLCFITTHKREGNVFTPVWVILFTRGCGEGVCGEEAHISPLETTTEVGSTHPTGMHSCIFIQNFIYFWNFLWRISRFHMWLWRTQHCHAYISTFVSMFWHQAVSYRSHWAEFFHLTLHKTYMLWEHLQNLTWFTIQVLDDRRQKFYRPPLMFVCLWKKKIWSAILCKKSIVPCLWRANTWVNNWIFLIFNSKFIRYTEKDQINWCCSGNVS